MIKYDCIDVDNFGYKRFAEKIVNEKGRCCSASDAAAEITGKDAEIEFLRETIAHAIQLRWILADYTNDGITYTNEPTSVDHFIQLVEMEKTREL